MEQLPITPKQLEILIFLYRFRFLNRVHIQTLLHHKDYRRINTWLKDLTDREYVGRIYSRENVGINIPAIYFLKPKARSVLQDQKSVNETQLKHVYREKLRSQTFINHCLFLANVYLLFLSETKDKVKLYYYTKTDLSSYRGLPEILPDAYMALKVSRKKMRRYFLDIIDEGVPRFAIRGKIMRYFEYFDSNQWQDMRDDPFPKVLIICPTEKLKKYLHKFVARTLEEEFAEIEFFVTTKNLVVDKGGWEKVEV